MVRVVNTPADSINQDLTDYESWLVSISERRSAEELAFLRQVCCFAEKAHRGQIRASGEPYFQHVIAVANILAGLNMDHETLAAAVLHDVVEDTPVTLDQIRDRFGETVAKLVDGVTKMDAIRSVRGQLDHGRREKANSETLRKMLLAMVEDVRVVLIKLADRLHNMRTLFALDEARQKRMAKETMEIFAPLANRLGIWQIKWELEDLSFRYLEPSLYKQIARLLNERRVDRENYINRFTARLQEALRRAGIEAKVSGRPKHIYSIYRKMKRKDLDYHQIYDVRAARVLVEHVRDCYAALGIVHTLWQYIPGEFDDYIATPKANNYRSLHTAVIALEGKTVEVQIRTYDMHRHSEYGVAAHWRYKEGQQGESGFDKKIAWLRQLLEWKDEVRDASDFVDNVQADIFQDRVYVFTPKGHVIDLPQGATPVDFAYHIHTEVGHRCRGAKVNGKMVPLTYPLRSGEQVEILTYKRGEPSRDWLNPHLGYIKTSKARSRVQHWFKHLNIEKNIAVGRSTLERELHRLGLTDVRFEDIARELNFNEISDMFAAIGRSDLRTSQILAAVQKLVGTPTPKKGNVTPLYRPWSVKNTDIQISGVGDLLTNLARCCKPVYGDSIRGYITRGRGVTVHRADCVNVLRYQSSCPERLIAIQWGGAPAATYPVQLRIAAYDRHGLLRDVTTVLANEGINVLSLHTNANTRLSVVTIDLTVEVEDIEKLSRILAKLNQLPNVIDSHRFRH